MRESEEERGGTWFGESIEELQVTEWKVKKAEHYCELCVLLPLPRQHRLDVYVLWWLWRGGEGASGCRGPCGGAQ